MADKKEVNCYFTDGRNIYYVECINKNREVMGKIEKAITQTILKKEIDENIGH